MTDAGIADALNRQTARLLVLKLDSLDEELDFYETYPWYHSPIGNTLMSENASSNADRAWLVGSLLSSRADGEVDARSYPADGDWDNLFAHIRAEILARRSDPKYPQG